ADRSGDDQGGGGDAADDGEGLPGDRDPRRENVLGGRLRCRRRRLAPDLLEAPAPVGGTLAVLDGLIVGAAPHALGPRARVRGPEVAELALELPPLVDEQ